MTLLDLLSFANSALYDALPYAVVCLGILWTAKYINFPDLTCSGTFVLGGALAAIAIVKWGWPVPAAVGLAILGGVVGGLLTAAFHVGFRIDRILSGILSAFVLYSVNLLLLNPTLPYKDATTLLTAAENLDREIVTESLNVGWHPWEILILLGVAVGVKMLMDAFLSSEMGLALRALEDENAGESVLLKQGLNPSIYRALALAAGNGVVGLAGALVSFKENAANAHRGFDVLITGLIIYLIGKQIHTLFWGLVGVCTRRSLPFAALFRVRVTTAAIIGAAVYFGLTTLSQTIKIDPGYAKILLAVFVAVSVADFRALLGRLRNGRSTTAEAEGDPAPTERLNDEAPAAGDLPALLVRNLTFRYPFADVETLRGVNLCVGKSKFVRMRGGNGSGKTTVLRLVAGFLDPESGSRIVVQGEDLARDRRARLRRIAYVDQSAQRGVVGVLTPEENLALAACGAHPSPWRRALTRRRLERLNDVLAKGGVPPRIVHQPAEYLSGGERQILNLLTLLAREQTPNIVFLDEPANNLDAANRKRCQRIIQILRDREVAVVWISHTDLDGVPADAEIDMDALNRDRPVLVPAQ